MAVPEGYFAILSMEKKSKTISVLFAEHPGVITYGDSWEHAERMAEEALSAALESDFDRELSLPKAKKPKLKKGQKTVFIRISPEVRMAYLLRNVRSRANLTQKQMAKKLDISYQAYQRMERPGRSNLTVLTLEKIAKAVNGELVLDLKVPKQKISA